VRSSRRCNFCLLPSRVRQPRDAAARGLQQSKFFLPSVTHLTPSLRCQVIPPQTVVWSYNFGEFAVTSRKPPFLRWLEEAEAKRMCEWAGLEHACSRRDIDAERSLEQSVRSSLLRRLRGLFGNQTVQIARDD